METLVEMHRATEARRNIAPSLAPFCVMEGQANDQNHQQRCSSQNYRQQSSALLEVGAPTIVTFPRLLLKNFSALAVRTVRLNLNQRASRQ
jgi:hypothetical protein